MAKVDLSSRPFLRPTWVFSTGPPSGKSCFPVVEAIDKFLSSEENEQRSNICDETVTLQHLILERASTWSCDGGFAPLVLRTWLHRRSRPSTRTEPTNQAPFVASKTFGT